MDKRIRLGFIYLWDSSWLGGVYYAQNLLKALNAIEDEKKPIVDVHCLNDKIFSDLQMSTNYPYLEKTLVKKILWRRILRKFLSFFSLRASSLISIINLNSQDDVYYPWSTGWNKKKLLMWKPDFQEKYLPEYFSKRDLKNRNNLIVESCKRSVPIVFSSNDSLSDFRNFYPKYKNNPSYVLHFAANIENYQERNINVIKEKYGITKDYILCTNQFWQHKNHYFLFRAFKKALDSGFDKQLVCTGRPYDNRSPRYSEKISDFLSENHLSNEILILGMIDKSDLLCLMRNSYAVVQPSLFEGWNTTVEDCKNINKFIFLSDLKVHREQIDKNVCFFNPRDEDDLKEKLLTVQPYSEKIEYRNNICEFGGNFVKILESICL